MHRLFAIYKNSKKKEEVPIASIQTLTWKKFKRSKISMISMFFILFLVLIALGGYLLSPDSTPYCNQQYLELNTLKPGSKATFLQINNPIIERGKKFILHKMLFGEDLQARMIPINKYWILRDSLYAETFSRTESSYKDTLSFSLLSLCFALDPSFPVRYMGDQILYKSINKNEFDTTTLIELSKRIEKQIVKKTFYLGTDRFGRDVLSQLMIGTRVSLSVGFIAVLISLFIGIILGALAGYFGGWIDSLIIWFINVVWSIPTILMVIAITFALGKGFWQVFIAVGLCMWVDVARLVRGQVMSIKEKEYIEAARALGFSSSRIIFKHIMPNIAGSIIVITASNFASAILLESGLSFLGIGVQPPVPSWGMMIRDNYPYILLDAAYLAFLPGVAVILSVLAFMLIGKGLRDAIDSRNT